MDKKIMDLLESAFETGYDAGLYRGFANANKEQSKQIPKPKETTFEQFKRYNSIA